MYKSSQSTFFFKYLFTPLMIVGPLIMINYLNSESHFFKDKPIIAFLSFLVALFWLIIMMIRLRGFDANDENIILKTIAGSKTINYSDIEWISQLAMISPKFISMKYFDKKTNTTKRILFIPKDNSGKSIFDYNKDLDVTIFIRNSIKKYNSGYLTENEPSKWLPFKLILISLIPSFSINLYYLLNF